MSGQPDLSIIIINWNSAAFLRKCLASIHENAQDVDFEVIVVDNASYDGCEEMIKREWPGIAFVQSRENIGFAGANNLGFRHSRGRNILFLNPDTVVLGSSLKAMVSFLDTRADAGMVGAKLLNSDLSVQLDCVKAFPSILNQVFDARFLKRTFPKLSLWGMKPLFDGGSESVSVDVVSGACMMIKRSVFEEVGYFNTIYFMYSEDVDLCFQVKRAGWKTYFQPSAGMVHYGGSSSNQVSEKNFADLTIRESRLKFLRATRGVFYATAYRSAMALVAAVRVSVLGLILLVTGGRFHRRTLARASRKWTKLLRWAVGLKKGATGIVKVE